MSAFDRLKLVPACTMASHEELRRSPIRLARETSPAGRQDDGDGGWLELRRCRACESTLAIPGETAPTPWMYRATAPDGSLAYVSTEEDAASWCHEYAREATAWERVYVDAETGEDGQAVALDRDEWLRIHTMLEQLRAGSGAIPAWADNLSRTLAVAALVVGALISAVTL